MTKRPVRDTAVLLVGLAGIATTAALLRLVGGVSPTTVALTLLLVVLATATFGRLWIATTVAIAATLTFNFFFLPPIFTLTIAEVENWIALFTFLIVAVIASKLSATVQARAQEAIARRNEVTRLFDLTRDVLLTTDTRGAIDVLARHVARRFELPRVAIYRPSAAGWDVHQGGVGDLSVREDVLNLAIAKARGTLEFDAHERAYGGHTTTTDGADTVLIVPLRHGTRPVGLLAAATSGLDLGALDAVAGVVAIAIERIQFLEEREAAERVRQKADLAATLLASLSHDLKTPLTAIRVALENLATEGPPEERREQAETAIVELDRLNRLFQDILDMARIDAEAIHVERQWVTPADVVDAAAAHVRRSLDDHRFVVDADAETDVEIDPRVASMALSQLLENAAKYSGRGTQITVHAVAEPDGLRIAVADEGHGLDAAELEHLFERFYRGSAARRLSPGTGLGLAITRGLLAAVGGRVWAENVSAGGARFTMVVPAARRPSAIGSPARGGLV